MGLTLSNTFIKSELSRFMRLEQVNELMTTINVILKSNNEVFIKNIAHVSHIGIHFANDIKNQIVANSILDYSQTIEQYDSILDRVTQEQINSGLLEIEGTNLTKLTNVRSHFDKTEINRQIQNIIQRFDFTNSFKVINDQLLPTSSIDFVDLEMTNKSFNSTLSEMLTKYETDIKGGSDLDTGTKAKQSADNSLILIALAVVAGYVLIKTN